MAMSSADLSAISHAMFLQSVTHSGVAGALARDAARSMSRYDLARLTEWHIVDMAFFGMRLNRKFRVAQGFTDVAVTLKRPNTPQAAC